MILDVVKALNPGMLFYEYDAGDIHELVTLTTPTKNEHECWEWQARVACPVNPNKKIIEYCVCEKFLDYAPDITLTPDLSYLKEQHGLF